MPDAKDDPWGETRLPLGVLFDNSLHQSKELRGVVLDFAVDLKVSQIVLILVSAKRPTLSLTCSCPGTSMRSKTSVNLGIGCTGFSLVLTCLTLADLFAPFHNSDSLEDTSPGLLVDLAGPSGSPAQLGIMEQNQNAIGCNVDI